jgi:hypothetical protein
MNALLTMLLLLLLLLLRQVHLKGTAVASGSAVPGEDRAWAAAAAAAQGGQVTAGRGGLLQEQQQLEARLARQCRDAQVSSAISVIHLCGACSVYGGVRSACIYNRWRLHYIMNRHGAVLQEQQQLEVRLARQCRDAWSKPDVEAAQICIC